jgi:hypothetical protein
MMVLGASRQFKPRRRRAKEKTRIPDTESRGHESTIMASPFVLESRGAADDNQTGSITGNCG